ncbi:hypothetical protein ACXGQW_03575 [Wenyingzhuangia sp. IMCC45533]
MKITFAFFFILSISLASAQEMTNYQLQKIVRSQSDSIFNKSVNFTEFKKLDRKLICLTDSLANRMRIISPISKVEDLSVEHVLASLAANFHTALDVKYAVSDGIMWSVYIHPLKELSEVQLKNAVMQVYNANVSFGTTYQSTNLIFGGKSNESVEESAEENKI